VIVHAGVISAAVLATVPAASLAGGLRYAHLLVAGLVVAGLFVFSDAAAFGVLPQLVGRVGLASATSALMISGTVVALIGPAVAGVLVALVDPALVIAIDAGAYLLVAAFMARLRWSGTDRAQRDVPSTVAGDIVAGLRFIWRQEVIRWLTIFGFGASLALGAVAGLLVVIGVEQVGLAQDAPQLGWLYAASALGTLIGSTLLPSLQRRFRIGRITSVGLFLTLLLLLALSGVHDLVLVLVLITAFQIPLMALILNGMVARSVLTPDAYQSRVNTTGRMIAGGGSPFGAVLAGIVADAAGTQWALRAAGLGILVSLLGVLSVGAHRYPLLRHLGPAAESGPPPSRRESRSLPRLSAVARRRPSGENPTASAETPFRPSRRGAAGTPTSHSRTDPSEPALARVRPPAPKATSLTPAPWPSSGRPTRRGALGSLTSHSRTVPDLPAVARVRPSGAKAATTRSLTVTFVGSVRSATRSLSGCGAVRSVTSHSRAVRSSAAVARTRPSGENATAKGAPSRVRSRLDGGPEGSVARSQRYTILFQPEAHARVRPSGENATSSTVSMPPVSGWTRRGATGSVRSHSRTVPSAPPLARVRPSGANATASIAPRWPVSGAPSGQGAAGAVRSHSRTVAG
jgi:hypothetical protein